MCTQGRESSVESHPGVLRSVKVKRNIDLSLWRAKQLTNLVECKGAQP
jgi:hypothetical protein